MNKSLEIAKNELQWLTNDYKAKPQHSRNKFQEQLKYEIIYNRKKTILTFTFIYMPKEEALAFAYEYKAVDKNSDKYEKHRFSDVLQDIELPGIDIDDVKRLKHNIGYEKVDGAIKGSLSPTTQAITYTEVIKRNIATIFDYGKEIK